MTLYKWSKTAASNSNSDATINWAEGQPPDSVNDSSRAGMAAMAKARDDWAGSLTTAGTSTAYTLTTNQVFTSLALMDGQKLKVRFHTSNGASPTLNIDGLGAAPIRVDAATAVGTGVIATDSIWDVTYDNSIPAIILSGVPNIIQDGTVEAASIAAGAVGTTALAANAVTYAKMQTAADQTLLGNVSGATAVPEAITIGSGLRVSGTTLSTAFPPSASVSGLSIKVIGNTSANLIANYITVTDGTDFQTLVYSRTINLATTGADALDTGTIAASTWYAVWAIAKSDGTTAGLVSTSFTAPTMPSGYTFKARVGALVTVSYAAQLIGTYQYGRRARYIIGVAQCASYPSIASGSTGATTVLTTPTWTAASISSAVPTTATSIFVMLQGRAMSSGQGVMAAPNSSYGRFDDTTTPPPLVIDASSTGGIWHSVLGEWTVESTNIYYASNTADAQIRCAGWEDNI